MNKLSNLATLILSVLSISAFGLAGIKYYAVNDMQAKLNEYQIKMTANEKLLEVTFGDIDRLKDRAMILEKSLIKITDDQSSDSRLIQTELKHLSSIVEEVKRKLDRMDRTNWKADDETVAKRKE